MKAVCRICLVTLIACLLATSAYSQSGNRPFQAHQPLWIGAIENDPVICSPAPCVLPPVQASEGGANVTDAPIAADPLNPQHLLVGSIDTNCLSSYAGFHFSPDAGSSWSLHCMPEINARQLTYLPGGGPMVGYDSNGVAYAGSVYGVPETYDSLVALQKSSDGVTWSTPEIALGPSINILFLYPSLAIDTGPQSPYAGTLYVSADVYNEAEGQTDLPGLAVSHSSDGGGTWKAVGVIQPQRPPAMDNYTSLAVSRDGSVYLTWQHCAGVGPNADCDHSTEYMLFSRSTDGGDTWSKPRVMSAAVDVPNACMCWPFGPIPNTDAYADNVPVIAVDNSSGPYAGNVYVAMYSWTGTYMRVEVIHSADGGNTWSKPVPVAPDSANHDQFFPWISVSPAGLVGVSWLDRRNDPNNIDYQAFAAISADGGQSFEPNVQLTTQFSTPYEGMGFYTGNTWDGPNYFVAAWMDDSKAFDYWQDYVGGIRLK